jgi:hypothetical protein
MRRAVRSGAILLALSFVAVLIAWLASRASPPTWPQGSSRSYQRDGAQALFLWAESLGARPQRLDRGGQAAGDSPPSLASTGLLLVIQPQRPIQQEHRVAFDEVPRRGGTLVLAGDSAWLRAYAASLGVEATSSPLQRTATTPGDGAAVQANSRLKLADGAARPLLLAPNGDWLALRKPYLSGSLVVIGSVHPLTNDGLRHRDTARFVYRELLRPLPPGAAVGFDEVHRGSPAAGPDGAGQPVGLRHLVFSSAPGRAIVYTAVVLFGYLVLSGRRFGTPLAPVEAAERTRPLVEHVQALAGLHRQARQFRYARRFFTERYQRLFARSLGVEPLSLDPAGAQQGQPPRASHPGVPPEQARLVAEALTGLARASSEADLIAAVRLADAAAGRLPRGLRGTLSHP